MTVALDRDAEWVDETTLLGGQPIRLVRLSTAGATAVRSALGGTATTALDRATPGSGALIDRMIAAGILHPRPEGGVADGGSVSAVIPAHNAERSLPALLDALRDLYEVIVVDDASTDRTAPVAERLGARVISLSRNGGPARARNVGIESATSSLVALLDADTLPLAGWLQPLLALLSDRELVAVAPRIVPASCSRSWVAGLEAADSALDMGEREGLVGPGRRIRYVPTAALVGRRSSIRAIGGFDPGLRYGEDVDLIWRLVGSGAGVRYYPPAQVAHRHPESLPDLISRRFRYGSSAGPLARRHPAAMRALEVPVLDVAPLLSLLGGSARLAAALCAASNLWARRKLPRGLPEVTALKLAGRRQRRLLEAGAFALRRSWAPLLVAASWRSARGRRIGLAAMVISEASAPRGAWSGPIDSLISRPVLRLIADLAYCAGSWWGCARARVLLPLLPRLRRSSGCRAGGPR